MAIQLQHRISGPYEGDGAAVDFPFSFTVFKPSEVSVVVSQAGAGVSEAPLTGGYTVTLNPDQDSAPGGTVRLDSPLETGGRLSILSAVPETQELVLTNRGGFYPEALNDAYDKLTALIQQLKADVERCIIVPATGSITREEMLRQLLEIAATASEYSAKAIAAYDAASDLKARMESELAKAQAGNLAQLAKTLADATASLRQTAEAYASFAALEKSVGAVQVVWTATEDHAAGDVITCPDGFNYYAGHNHFTLALNGTVLMPGLNFVEQDPADDEFTSTKVQILFPIEKGDELMFRAHPLGSEEVASAVEKVEKAQTAVEDARKQIAAAQTVVLSAQSEITEARAEIATARSEISDAKDAVIQAADTATTASAEANEAVNNATEAVTTAQTAAKAAAASLSELESKVSTATADVESARSDAVSEISGLVQQASGYASAAAADSSSAAGSASAAGQSAQNAQTYSDSARGSSSTADKAAKAASASADEAKTAASSAASDVIATIGDTYVSKSELNTALSELITEFGGTVPAD